MLTKSDKAWIIDLLQIFGMMLVAGLKGDTKSWFDNQHELDDMENR